MTHRALGFLFFALAAQPARALYVQLSSESPLCFYEKLSPKETLFGMLRNESPEIVGADGSRPKTSGQDYNVNLMIKNRAGIGGARVVHKKRFRSTDFDNASAAGGAGVVAFEYSAPAVNSAGGTAPEDFQICLSVARANNRPDAITIERLVFDLKTVEHLSTAGSEVPVKFSDIAREEHLNDIVTRVAKVSRQVDFIDRRLTGYRILEGQIRDVAESNSDRVAFLSLAQTVIIFAVGCWQMSHLQGFFRKKKLI
jgi:hypothetical protein